MSGARPPPETPKSTGQGHHLSVLSSTTARFRERVNISPEILDDSSSSSEVENSDSISIEEVDTNNAKPKPGRIVPVSHSDSDSITPGTGAQRIGNIVHSTPFVPLAVTNRIQFPSRKLLENCEESIIEKSFNSLEITAAAAAPAPSPMIKMEKQSKKHEKQSTSKDRSDSDGDEEDSDSFKSANQGSPVFPTTPTSAEDEDHEMVKLLEKSLKIKDPEDEDTDVIEEEDSDIIPISNIKNKKKKHLVVLSDSDDSDIEEIPKPPKKPAPVFTLDSASSGSEDEKEEDASDGFTDSSKENFAASDDSYLEDQSPEELQLIGARTGAIPKPPKNANAVGAFAPKFAVPTSSIISKLLQIIETIPDPREVDIKRPKRLRVDLYAHQAYGLRWLWWREHQIPGGGILADEMGLGKTIMILALICKGLEEGSPDYEKKDKWLSKQSSRLLPSRGTLIVVPSSVMGQWESEISKKSKGMVVYQYHGPNRARSASVLSRYDIVLTTYGTLGSDMPKGDEYGSPLAKVLWDRVVLDEGHTIRNHVTTASNACCFLNAKHRWIVTGTPVHNRPGDMYSLVKFLGLHPFADKATWDEWIGMKKVLSAAGAERLNTIGKAIILRRTKEQVKGVGADEDGIVAIPDGNHAQLPSIPDKTIEDIPIELNPEERRVYEHLFDYAKEFFTNFLKDHATREQEKQFAGDNFAPKKRGGGGGEGEDGKSQFGVLLTYLLRLRQCTVLPHLISAMIDDDDDADRDLNVSQQLEEDFISLKNPVFAENYESSKIQRLLQELEKLRNEAKADGRPMDKVIVLSQWTSLLNIIGSHLSRQGFSYTSITGEVKQSERTYIVESFNTNPKRPQVMLLSLMAGGVGLNLIGANIMYVMDLHWNPQNELQAHDRIHRFGQKKEVKIYRLICENTIDGKVNNIQIEKKQLANSLLDSAKKSRGPGLNLQDMRKLFGC